VISVLCPSRKNPELLAKSIRSLRTTADHPPEILIAADDDDMGTITMATDLTGRVFISPRAGYDRLHEYYQQLAIAARGDWLLVWNDDATMETLHWDAEIEALPPEVYVADIGSVHSPMCCFPAVRREAVQALGRFCTNNPHVDTFWGDISTVAGVIQKVAVYVNCTPLVRGNPHDFYAPWHQAEMVKYAEILRNLAMS
jgi:hypothetical protein